jgi:alpha/beta superfamily hydrolase
MTARNEVFFRCGSIVLEGVLELPEGFDGPFPGAVICHPHPLYGGNMFNNMTSALKKGLLARGTACLRFNFRGTGQSEGSHGEGLDELEDVRAALDYLTDQETIDPDRIVVAGYSFGCWVGLRAAAKDSRPSRLIGISPRWTAMISVSSSRRHVPSCSLQATGISSAQRSNSTSSLRTCPNQNKRVFSLGSITSFSEEKLTW